MVEEEFFDADGQEFRALEREALLQEEIDLQHPITFKNFNLCVLQSKKRLSDALKKLKLCDLREMQEIKRRDQWTVIAESYLYRTTCELSKILQLLSLEKSAEHNWRPTDYLCYFIHSFICLYIYLFDNISTRTPMSCYSMR